MDCEDGEDEDRFQDYYGIVVESRQELTHPEQPIPSRLSNEDECERLSGHLKFLKRETPKPRLPLDGMQRAISPPHSVRISVQRSKEQDKEPKKEVPNYMKPIQKTLIQKELTNEEQKPKDPNATEKEAAGWNERFWIQPQGLKPEQEESPTAKQLAAKGKKFKDVKAKVDTTRNQ